MPASRSDSTLACFAPALAPDTKVLILGSFPSAASLAAQQYYAHPQNQFWRLISAVIGEDMVGIDYQLRLQRLLAHHIGLWDVIAECERNGSLDTSIKNVRLNDFSFLWQLCPKLTRICFNGKTSGRLAPHFAATGYDTLVLPSSSPANARLSFAQKLEAWREMIE